VIIKLHEHHGVAPRLEQHIGLAAAGPVGQPIDLRCIASGAVNEQGIEARLVDQRRDALVARGELGV
jgi:hypothetical protein